MPSPSQSIDIVVTVGFDWRGEKFLIVFHDKTDRFAREYMFKPRSSISCWRRSPMSIIVSPPTDNSMRFLSDIKSIRNAIHIEILSDYKA